jgi:hypothetical protein
MKIRFMLIIAKGVVLIMILVFCTKCNVEDKSPDINSLYKVPGLACSFVVDGENINIPIANFGGYGISYDNQKDSLEIDYTLMYETVNKCFMEFHLKKYYHRNEIAGFTMETPSGWEVMELSQPEILLAFREGYYKNMYNHNHGAARNRITMYYTRYIHANAFSNYFMFDMDVRYDVPPENCGYFHLYDVQILDNCNIGFKADFEGLGYADMQIKEGHLEAIYFNRSSDACYHLRNFLHY